MVFQCECCQYSTPFKYTFKQHLGTKKHLAKIKDVPKVSEQDVMEKMRLRIEEQEKTIEEQKEMLDTQTTQIDQMISRLKRVGSNMGNTTNNTVQNIHILLHPDMNLTQLTHYDYQVILKKIQDRDFKQMEKLEDLGIGEDD